MRAIEQRARCLADALEGDRPGSAGDADGVLEGSLCPAVQDVVWRARQVARTDTPVLILGETGSGKEWLARDLHRWSARAAQPFIKMNCAAIAAGVLESELFGHVKGAFTGAVRDRPGRFQIADGGTLLLDEIGELPLELQAKLLRVGRGTCASWATCSSARRSSRRGMRSAPACSTSRSARAAPRRQRR